MSERRDQPACFCEPPEHAGTLPQDAAIRPPAQVGARHQRLLAPRDRPSGPRFNASRARVLHRVLFCGPRVFRTALAAPEDRAQAGRLPRPLCRVLLAHGGTASLVARGACARHRRRRGAWLGGMVRAQGESQAPALEGNLRPPLLRLLHATSNLAEPAAAQDLVRAPRGGHVGHLDPHEVAEGQSINVLTAVVGNTPIIVPDW
mmetsp:Transcript_90464/g.292819  ORF Transcript_90464/g.292819 Transcript_90464/m.292819 type:complete len:204 (-) Transcript_90464:121-732(-)